MKVFLREFTVADVQAAIDGNYLAHDARVAHLGRVSTVLPSTIGIDSVFYETQSSTGDNIYWKQIFNFKDLIAFTDRRGSAEGAFEAYLKEGDVELLCTCPAFLYWGYKYITSQLDLNVGPPENRAPTIRNPDQRGVVCKHLDLAMGEMGGVDTKLISKTMEDKLKKHLGM